MIEKDSQGRGWELKYAIYVDDKEFEEDSDAVEFINNFFRKYAMSIKMITDWDGPL